MCNSEFVLVNNDNQGTLTYAVRANFSFDVKELYNQLRQIPRSLGAIGFTDLFNWLTFYNKLPCEIITTKEYVVSVERQGTPGVQMNQLWNTIEDDVAWHIILYVVKKDKTSWIKQDNEWVRNVLIPLL